MQYYINLNQEKVIEWELSLSNAVIFSWIYEGASWAETKASPDGSIFYFLSRNKCLDDLPMVTTKKDTIWRAYKALEESGLIQFQTQDSKDWIRITDKGKTWRRVNGKISEGSEKNPDELGKKSELPSEKNPTYYNINNTILLDTIDKNNKKDIESISWSPEMTGGTKFENIIAASKFPSEYEHLLRLILKYTKKQTAPNDKKAIASLKEILKVYSMEDIESVIKEISVNDWCVKNNFSFVTPEYILRPRVFDNYLSTAQLKQSSKQTNTFDIHQKLREMEEVERQERLARQPNL
jgi:hypothetical protein